MEGPPPDCPAGALCVLKKMLRIFFEKGDRTEFGLKSTFFEVHALENALEFYSRLRRELLRRAF